jgi:2',3'-cyclic-nucleotide 2'-phosphodiesterase
MTNRRITGPAASSTAHSPTTASGSSTSCTHRGTITRESSGMTKVWSPPVTSILFIGDVVARAGRRVVRDLLPGLREELGLDFVVANGENAAGGIGITPKEADELFKAGVDVITLGNHTYRHREVWPYLDQQPHILRPANFLRTQPGRGTCVVERDGVSLGVVNLSGNLYMQAGSPALVTIDEALKEVGDADHVLVDMHAEATSEKVALGWYLDGRVTAVVGTHTHVPTADARVLPGGTAYITDVGMTGARGGVIGVRREQSIAVMRSHMPQRYDSADDDPWLNAVVIRAGGRTADSIEQVLRPGSGP